ncbi:FHA domain-containing protein [bacterium]|nr:FHA domain-containing protein [bacterium]
MKIEITHNGEVVFEKDLAEGNYTIGRADGCEIRLKSSRVSKQHAALVIKGNRAAIIDLGSSNGIFINGVMVKKQRIETGDDVDIAGFKLHAAPRRPGSAAAAFSGGIGAFDGNAALAASPMENQAPEATPQEKLLTIVDQKVLLPFYHVIKRFDWRWVLGSILLGSLVLSTLLSVIPILRWSNQTARAEALARAHSIVAQAVRENYRILSKSNDFTRLTVENMEAEKGVLSSFVIDPKTSGILAPAKYFNKSVTDVYSLLAIKRVLEAKEEQVSVEKASNVYVVAQPVYLYSQEAGDRQLQAIVLAVFQLNLGITSTFQPMVEAALFSVLMSLLAFFLIYKMFTFPVMELQEQLDAALKGETPHITTDVKFPELQNLATTMNFSVSRNKSGGPSAVTPVQTEEGDKEDALFSAAVKEMEVATSDGLLLLDGDKKVRFVGKILEDLIGMRTQYAQGQNVSDACRDQSFAGTVIDLAEGVSRSLGEVQSSQLDINGVSRTMIAVGHKNTSGEIRFFLITVKMNAA